MLFALVLALLTCVRAKVKVEYAEGVLRCGVCAGLVLGLVPVHVKLTVYKGLNGLRLLVDSPVYQTDQSLKSLTRRKKKPRKKLKIAWKDAVCVDVVHGQIGFENPAALALLCGGMEGLLRDVSALLGGRTQVSVIPVFGAKGMILKLTGIVRLWPLHIIFAILTAKRRKKECPIP